MGFEIELKARCDSYDEMKKKIALRRHHYAGTERQADSYFNHPSRDFKTTDEALRIRTVKERNILTYKGPRLGGTAKVRIEQEVDVRDFKTMEAILINLGFKKSMEVKKEREIYVFDDITLCLDNVNGLGFYVEFEKISENRVETEKELLDFAAQFDIFKFEGRSYLEILMDKERGV